MKKVLFIQLKSKSYAGVWQVNKTVGEALIEKGYQVSIVSLRENKNNIELEHNPKLELHTINKIDVWEETYTGSEILKDLKKIKIFNATKKILVRIKHEISIKKDTKKLHEYIYNFNPDYIITTHYELIDLVPKELLNKTIYEHHTSFRNSIKHKDTRRIFNKYKDKIKFVWLTKQTMQDAIEYGLKNSYYIYNAVRFKSNEIADITNNKKLITIARFSKEKRIDLMIEIVEDIFKDKKFQDWTLEIYGNGPEEENIKKVIHNHKQIKLMGLTDNPQKELLNSSINLNTSSFEGFSLSILEANECGVPTITFNFGESVYEEIINEQTGIIVKNKEEYIDILKKLMLDKNKLNTLSKNAKEFSKSFQIEEIINEWIKLFNRNDK